MTSPLNPELNPEINPEDPRDHSIDEDGHTAALPETGVGADHTDEPADTATDNLAASEEPTTER